jgi:hypothetical protein
VRSCEGLPWWRGSRPGVVPAHTTKACVVGGGTAACVVASVLIALRQWAALRSGVCAYCTVRVRRGEAGEVCGILLPALLASCDLLGFQLRR